MSTPEQRERVQEWLKTYYYAFHSDVISAIETVLADAERFGELRGAVRDIVCSGCDNRIGWTGPFDDQQRAFGRRDWRACSGCREIRALLPEEPA